MPNTIINITKNGTATLDTSDKYLLDDIEIVVDVEKNRLEDSRIITPGGDTQVIVPEDGYEGIRTIIVQKIPDNYITVEGTLPITTNGTYNVTKYAKVDVNIPIPEIPTINLQDKSVTPSEVEQVISADEEYTGLRRVTVRKIPSTYVAPVGTLSIDANGEYNVRDYEKALVNIDTGEILQQDDKVIVPTEAQQIILPDDGFGGFSKITVERIPEDYLIPEGTLEITENGKSDITSFKYVQVSVPTKDRDALQGYIEAKGNTAQAFFANSTVADFEFLSGLDTSKVTNMYEMFKSCTKAVTIPYLPMTSVTNAGYMYSGCSSLTTAGSINMPVCTSATYMFSGCSKLTDVGTVNMPACTNASRMFSGCSSLTNVEIEGGTPNLTNAEYMFHNCSKIPSIPAISYDKVTDLDDIFYGCSTMVNDADIIINAPNATYATYAFYNCSSLEGPIKISLGTTSSLNFMFQGCKKLKKIEVSSKSTSSVSMNYTFDGCRSLEELIIDARSPSIVSTTFNHNNSLKTLIFKNITAVPALTNFFPTYSGILYHFNGTVSSIYNPYGKKDGVVVVPLSMLASCRSSWSSILSNDMIIPYVDSVSDLTISLSESSVRCYVVSESKIYEFAGGKWAAEIPGLTVKIVEPDLGDVSITTNDKSVNVEAFPSTDYNFNGWTDVYEEKSLTTTADRQGPIAKINQNFSTNSMSWTALDDGWYSSTSINGYNYGYAIARINFTNKTLSAKDVKIEYSCTALPYDICAYIGKLDTALSKSYYSESASWLLSMTSTSSAKTGSLTVKIPAGEHFIDIKFSDYSGNSTARTFKFKLTGMGSSKTVTYVDYGDVKSEANPYVIADTDSLVDNPVTLIPIFEYDGDFDAPVLEDGELTITQVFLSNNASNTMEVR